MSCPDKIQYWTADEVAECLDGVSKELYQRLWQLSGDAQRRKPLGGDGSDGTTEEPIVADDYDDSMPQIWKNLTAKEQAELWKLCRASDDT